MGPCKNVGRKRARKTIRVQQVNLFGHFMRNKEVDNMIITYNMIRKSEGKRSHGNQELALVKSLSN